MATLPPPARRTTDPSPPKTTLYCPDCGHDSPHDGDWRRQPTSDGVALVCPRCTATLTVRPRSN
jgi:predicted RNA-binding Zn-ribbon protein involved in translation (DUF1610 family)